MNCTKLYAQFPYSLTLFRLSVGHHEPPPFHHFFAIAEQVLVRMPEFLILPLPD